MIYIDSHGNKARIVMQDNSCILKFYNRRGKLCSSLELEESYGDEMDKILSDNGFSKNHFERGQE